ncbi:MAG: chromate transporter [Eubacteriales bacterium]|nr:chromate transporter [Eubacteriales bacterium]
MTIYLIIFLTFFKIGLFTFGGGYAMLPLIQEEVLTRGWVENADLINFIAVSESTPGPFAINMATYIGNTMGGFLGALSATLGVVTPSFVVILFVANVFEKFKTNKIVSGCMTGLKPAVIGLIGAAVISVAETVFVAGKEYGAIFADARFYISAAIFAVMTVLAFKKVHPIVIIIISAVIGIVSGYLI